MAGRRPKPRALKLITGNPGKRPLRDDEPEGVPGWPDKPGHLGKIAAAEWDKLAELLEGEHRLTLSDSPMLTGAAVAYETALAFEAKSRRRGIPDDEWRKFRTGARIQWDTYRKFVNDLCLSQGTRAKASNATAGGRGKATSRISEYHARRAAAQNKTAKTAG